MVCVVIMMSKQHCFFTRLPSPKLAGSVLFSFALAAVYVTICQVILVNVILVYAALVCLVYIYLEENFESLPSNDGSSASCSGLALLNNLTLSHVQAVCVVDALLAEPYGSNSALWYSFGLSWIKFFCHFKNRVSAPIVVHFGY
ncbi:hypothetical protein E2542_SST15199 [Spatholobus suberectus]|nr:hypothetical protein E2542_SST15197 [Spatholobus suberectus]TKY58143.1 hypothetical protein E2542_SST15199 [Spatholobus suberectus]